MREQGDLGGIHGPVVIDDARIGTVEGSGGGGGDQRDAISDHPPKPLY